MSDPLRSTEHHAEPPRPEARTRSADATREAIIHHAEALFARDGIDGTTLRRIARAAGQRNVGAVQYHFGSREGLLSAILERHQNEIDARRQELLDADEAAGRHHELAALLQVLVMPLVRKLDDPSGRAYLQIQAQRRPAEAMLPATRRMVLRFRRALGERSDSERDPLRDRFAFLLLFHALAERAQAEQENQESLLPRPAFVVSLVRALRGVFLAADDGSPRAASSQG